MNFLAFLIILFGSVPGFAMDLQAEFALVHAHLLGSLPSAALSSAQLSSLKNCLNGFQIKLSDQQQDLFLDRQSAFYLVDGANKTITFAQNALVAAEAEDREFLLQHEILNICHIDGLDDTQYQITTTLRVLDPQRKSTSVDGARLFDFVLKSDSVQKKSGGITTFGGGGDIVQMKVKYGIVQYLLSQSTSAPRLERYLASLARNKKIDLAVFKLQMAKTVLISYVPYHDLFLNAPINDSADVISNQDMFILLVEYLAER